MEASLANDQADITKTIVDLISNSDEKLTKTWNAGGLTLTLLVIGTLTIVISLAVAIFPELSGTGGAAPYGVMAGICAVLFASIVGAWEIYLRSQSVDRKQAFLFDTAKMLVQGFLESQTKSNQVVRVSDIKELGTAVQAFFTEAPAAEAR